MTASPAKGIEATVELGEQLQAAASASVPHLSARMIRDRAHLAELLDRLARRRDRRGRSSSAATPRSPGEYLDGLSLLRAMADLGHPFAEIGVPCYPQGHPDIPDDALLEALARQGRRTRRT